MIDKRIPHEEVKQKCKYEGQGQVKPENAVPGVAENDQGLHPEKHLEIRDYAASYQSR